MPSSPSPFALLAQRRFAPYFATQALGAFNDNVYKNALVALIGYAGAGAAVAVATDGGAAVATAGGASDAAGGGDALLINVAAGLFILPFFLFSAFAGQVAERYEKSMLIRRIKLAEIAIMLAGAAALFSGSAASMIAVLFLMGTQSAFYGPIKYGILPQHLDDSELVGGNGLVELGTFLAILLGTIGGTQLVTRAGGSVAPAAAVVAIVAALGWVASRGVPRTPAADPALTLRWEPVGETVRLVRETAGNRTVFLSILGISWFWFLGATYLAQFLIYARDVLGGGPDVFTLLLATFSIAIGAGSVLCSRLSHGRVELGIVPFGAAGLTLFGLDLALASPDAPLGTDLGIAAFASAPGALRVLADVFLIGLFGGLYIVPLYALVQERAPAERMSRTFACNNVLNAAFMVVSALFAVALLALGASIPQLFLVLALLNACVALYIFRLVPEFLMRFLVWLLVHALYRVRPVGLERIPERGAAIIAPNHVSFVDALVVGGVVRRPVRFVMHRSIFRIPVLNFVFRTARAIPIAGRSEDPGLYERAFADMRAALDAGDLLCLFPEGRLTADGEVGEFRPGIVRLLETHPAPVYPVALQGLWRSLFSRRGGRAFLKWPRRLFARIGLVVGEPMRPADVTTDGLRSAVVALRGERR